MTEEYKAQRRMTFVADPDDPENHRGIGNIAAGFIVDKKAKKLMMASTKLTYPEAVRQVFAENPVLGEEYTKAHQ